MQLSTPATEHLPDLFEMFRQVCVLLGINRMHYPRELEQDLQEIDSADASVERYEFFWVCTIAREETKLNCG